ncbi:unnamed protein product, partial [Polarella glacialis]
AKFLRGGGASASQSLSLSFAPSAASPAAFQDALGERVKSPLEAARERLHARFVAKWPAAGLAAPVAAGAPSASAAFAPESSDHLEAARQRLRARFLSKWPTPAPAVDFTPEAVLSARHSEVGVFCVKELGVQYKTDADMWKIHNWSPRQEESAVGAWTTSALSLHQGWTAKQVQLQH